MPWPWTVNKKTLYTIYISFIKPFYTYQKNQTKINKHTYKTILSIHIYIYKHIFIAIKNNRSFLYIPYTIRFNIYIKQNIIHYILCICKNLKCKPHSLCAHTHNKRTAARSPIQMNMTMTMTMLLMFIQSELIREYTISKFMLDLYIYIFQFLSFSFYLFRSLALFFTSSHILCYFIFFSRLCFVNLSEIYGPVVDSLYLYVYGIDDRSSNNTCINHQHHEHIAIIARQMYRMLLFPSDNTWSLCLSRSLRQIYSNELYYHSYSFHFPKPISCPCLHLRPTTLIFHLFASTFPASHYRTNYKWNSFFDEGKLKCRWLFVLIPFVCACVSVRCMRSTYPIHFHYASTILGDDISFFSTSFLSQMKQFFLNVIDYIDFNEYFVSFALDNKMFVCFVLVLVNFFFLSF